MDCIVKIDGEEMPATERFVSGQVGDALIALRKIVKVGRDDLDADLLLAEQALRRVKNALDAHVG